MVSGKNRNHHGQAKALTNAAIVHVIAQEGGKDGGPDVDSGRSPAPNIAGLKGLADGFEFVVRVITHHYHSTSRRVLGLTLKTTRSMQDLALAMHVRGIL